MSNKLTTMAIITCAALAAGMWAQDKPSPFRSDSSTVSVSGSPSGNSSGVTSAPNESAPPPPPPAESRPAYANRGNAATTGSPEQTSIAPAPDFRPAPAAPPAPRPAASRDPFPEDVLAINQADSVWRTAQNRLEELGSGCIASGSQIIDQARDSKLKSVANYAKYYQDTISYWTKSRDSAGEAEMSSRTDSAELQAHVNQLQLELQSVNRRKADLDRTFGENHVDSAEEKAALQDLTRIQATKQEQVEKARAALDQNKAGHDWVMKRKEYARVRLSEVNDLLQSTRTELYLYQQLYNAILYRHSLSCDREIARPVETMSDWRQDLKKLSATAE